MPEPLKSAMLQALGPQVAFSAGIVIQGVLYPLPLVFHFHHKETPAKTFREAEKIRDYLKTVPLQTWN
jgi:hypothetical protein